MKIEEAAKKLGIQPSDLIRVGRRLGIIDEGRKDPKSVTDEQMGLFDDANLQTIEELSKKQGLAEDDILAMTLSSGEVAGEMEVFSEAEFERMKGRKTIPADAAKKMAAELGMSWPIGLTDPELRTKLVVALRGWAGTPNTQGRPTVAVFGAGIAGMTAAHELAERGFDVTVYEPTPDERPLRDKRVRNVATPKPKVKVGGLAASQYTRQGEPPHFWYGGDPRPDYGAMRPGPPDEGGEEFFPGEHGFRFFPAYYMHIWDMMQRIPLYEARVVPKGMDDFDRIASVLDRVEVEQLIIEVPHLRVIDNMLANGPRRAPAGLNARIDDYFEQRGRAGPLQGIIEKRLAEGSGLRNRLTETIEAKDKERADELVAAASPAIQAYDGEAGSREILDTALAEYLASFGQKEPILEHIRALDHQFADELLKYVSRFLSHELIGSETVEAATAEIRWVPTDRTVYDNVSRIVTQATTTTDGRPTVIFPREAPRSMAEMLGAISQFRDLGFTQDDLRKFMSRLVRYLVTSPLRRSLELEQISAYDFFTGRDEKTGHLAYQYSATFDHYLKDLPKVLAAFDCEWGDARTNIDTLLQLQLRIDRRDNKADGVLNGPTTTAWFDHWYQHLHSRMGVEFVPKGLRTLRLVGDELHCLIEGEDPIAPDYVVIATDAVTAEKVTRDLRDADVGGTVLELEGFSSSEPPEVPPRKLIGPVTDTPLGRLRRMTLKELRREAKRRGHSVGKSMTRFELIEELRPTRYARRDHESTELRAKSKADLLELAKDHGLEVSNSLTKAQIVEKLDPEIRRYGRQPWDRFQTLAGIQYFFDTDFQLARGHVYYSGSEWALSSINQAGLWEDQPILNEDGFVSILSVDIGDWNTPSPALADNRHPHGKAAWECSVEEIAHEVWRQIGHALSNDRQRDGVQTFPEPVSYSVDAYLELEDGGKGAKSKIRRNANPYLVPIVGDWQNRPGGYPWDPHGTSVAYVREPADRRIHENRQVWMADHGGYEVHCDSLVFAGTWTKTFTRMTTMEAACESARHAVNAILDHWTMEKMAERGLDDPRGPSTVGLDWRWPYGFVDAEGTFPVRQPSPAGDYCFIFNIENTEPADFRPTRVVDERFADRGLPHPWEAQGTDSVMAAMSQGAMAYDPTMPLDPFSPAYLRWLLQHMKNWRVLFEALYKITDPDEGEEIDLDDPLGAKDVDTAPPGWVAISPTSGRFDPDDQGSNTAEKS